VLKDLESGMESLILTGECSERDFNSEFWLAEYIEKVYKNIYIIDYTIVSIVVIIIII
jgi:hypothetical protein